MKDFAPVLPAQTVIMADVKDAWLLIIGWVLLTLTNFAKLLNSIVKVGVMMFRGLRELIKLSFEFIGILWQMHKDGDDIPYDKIRKEK